MNILKPNMIFKVLALVLALLGYYISPYGPNIGIGGPVASESQNQPGSATSGSFYLATVTRVADGDTITVRNTDGAIHKIRMHAVDAPELNQAGGEQAKRWLTQQVLNKDVKIIVNNTDRYKRQVAKVVMPLDNCQQRLCDGETDINLKAIEAGHAWWYREFARSQSSEDRVLYEAAEDQARTTRKGLWQQTAPLAPWQWRTEQRNQR
ncbi:thermonuclease family protein [Limnobacter sp.]|uniref:thermonuclease family protein n=1 Tax=Limnobacter sp. TaxID=2003368 RepID=UPI0025C60F44|nr:thermonuclease family protein [Limnobacter sp.]